MGTVCASPFHFWRVSRHGSGCLLRGSAGESSMIDHALKETTSMARYSLALCAALILVPNLKAAAEDAVARYDKVRTIRIGGEGGWDFLEVDAANRKLYVARGTRVVVIDLESEKVVGEIPDTPGVHGIAFVHALNRGFTSNGGDSTVTVFDLKTLKTLGRVKANGRPYIICFEPVSNRVFTMNHGTNDITAIDPEAMQAVGSLPAEGVPELAVSDDKGHVWVNLEDKSEILQFDAKTLKVLNKFSLAPGEEPTGLAFDPKSRRLFSTCNNKLLVIADADSGKVVQTLPIGPGPDGCVRDVSSGLIFASSGGDGTVAIVREASPGKYEVAKTVKTQVSAKTIALDPKTHRLYLSAATPEPPAANADKAAPRGRRRYLPDSFVVVVVGE
jgi:DNA-binding beta-propeller fold protein YncE